MSEVLAAPANASAAPHAIAPLLVCAPAAGDSLLRLAIALRTAAPQAALALAVPAEAGSSDIDLPAAQEISVTTVELPREDNSLLPWFMQAEALRAVAGVAERAGAAHVLLLGRDFADLSPEDFAPILHALSDRPCAVVSPLYDVRATDGLLNSAVLYPLLRALYGKRVRFPLASVSGASLDVLRRAGRGGGSAPGPRAIILPVEAAAANLPVCQVRISIGLPQVAGGREPSEILTEIVGPVFADMELKAPLWQRVRVTEEVETVGGAVPPPLPAEPEGADTHRMIEQFQLAARNLSEVWGLVMPPATQLSLKRLANFGEGGFRMPDDIWARVVYDFALAHRTRVIGRGHLFGAFTPLYLGWVASFLGQPQAGAAARIESQARAFESEKPYLLQRWRWPDRFHP